MHNCEYEYPEAAYGAAVDYCKENSRGEFWIGNEEYETRVNFCPFCGVAAPNPVSVEDLRNARLVEREPGICESRS
jgi:hypothetical protein